MHLLVERNIEIQKPAAVVFDYVSNMERFGEWFPGVLSIESANTLVHGQVGKEYLETVAVPLRGKRKIKLAVKEVQPNKLFVTEGKFPPLLPRMEIALSEAGAEACTLTWRMFSRNNDRIVRLALLPLARHLLGKRATAGLHKLKRRMEMPEPA